ncbi:MAG: hypothetical protein IJ485_06595 [Lachnospiraceae bacterium]|nr:hypothetical protein [Lachnospiraceae bacterium]
MADIHNIKEDTVKIRIQGGIIAAGALNGIFMVHSVMAVSTVGKVKRDLNREEHIYTGQDKANTDKSFSQILEREVGQRRTDSLNCQNVTYGMDRQLHYFNYRAREYNY